VELNAYLVILWRRKWIIAITLVTTMLVTIGSALMQTPTYKASATLRASVLEEDFDYGDLDYADRLLNTYPSIIKSGPMRAELREQLGRDATPHISVRFPAESELMLIVVEDEDPVLAAESANILARLFIDSMTESPTDQNLKITLIDPAVPPRSPSSQRNMLYFAFGAMLGLAGGLGLAFLFEHLDTTLYTVEQIEGASKATVLARIPQVKDGQPVIFPSGESHQGDAFRRLQTNLLTPCGEQPLRTLMVTSTVPGEGKSTIVANLAQVLAQSGHKVPVVDCSLRLPTLHRVFGVSNGVGLSSVLQGQVASSEAIQTTKASRIHILTSGPLPANPTDLLASPQTSVFLDELARQYDQVLLDTPALLPVIDAAAIAPSVDGTLLVVQRARVRREDLQAVLKQLTFSRAGVVGIAVNRTQSARRCCLRARHDEEDWPWGVHADHELGSPGELGSSPPNQASASSVETLRGPSSLT